MIDNKLAQGEDGLSDNMDLAQTILNSIATIDNISGIEDMHDAISSTLGMIGEKTGAERVYIFDRQDDNPDVFTNSYEWCAEGVAPQIDNLLKISASEMPYWVDKFNRGETIVIDDIENIKSIMPDEYKILIAQDIKSEISVPIFYKGHLSGFIGLDNPCGQPELLIKLLSLVGTHIGISRANMKMLTLLRKKQKELENNIAHIQNENDILMVLCADNASVYHVDLINDTAQVVKVESYTNVFNFIRSEERITICYSKTIKSYYDNYVVNSSSPNFLKKLSRENLMKELSDKDRISIRFMSVPNKRGQVFFEARASKIKSDSDKFLILLDFRHIDEIVKEECERREKLESALKLAKFNNDIIFAISKIYFLIYRIDIIADCFEEISSGSTEHRLTGKKGKASFELRSMCSSFMAPKYREKANAFFDIATLKKRLKNDESTGTEYLTCDGNWHLARFIVQERDKNGDPAKLLFVVRIITEEKQREKSWIIAAEEANRANEAKSDFLSRMSHDIRTPMNVIMGFVNIAIQNLDNREKLADCLEKIKYSGNNLQELINDTLDLSKIESGHFELNAEPSCLTEIFDFFKQSMLGAGIGKKLYYNCDLHDIEHNIVSVDRIRLGQIVINLLSNAVKYTPDGGTVSLEMYEESSDEPENTRLVVIVSDTGIGMSEEFMSKMYDEFTRAVDTRVNKVRGSGLGLAIAKKLSDLMGGTIEVTSKLQEGTSFRLTINIPYLDETAISDENKEEDSCLGKGMHLLVAEDNELNYEILSEQLEMHGITCDHAENGKICVDMFTSAENFCYDAVLMDMQMPVMDGSAAAKAIRRLNTDYAKNVPIIAVTANAYSEDVKKCKDAGMDGHISKPVNIGKIIKLIVELKNKY